MPQALDNNATQLERITARLRDLEGRVAALEGHPQNSVPSQYPEGESSSTALHTPRLAATTQGPFPVEMPSGAMPVLGKAVLGIAGAYLLRAIAQAGPIPKLTVVIVAIVYAALWMAYAVRTHDTNRFASSTYAITSVLILAPLLWESTVRFQVIPPTYSAAVLVALSLLALALSRRHQLQLIPWVATLAVVITILALMIATHELVPLTVAILAVAAITESAVCLNYRLSLRGVPAIVADFVIWLLVTVMTPAEAVPESYQPTSPLTISILCFSLLAIYGGSIGLRSFALRQRLSIFEIVQCVLAFVLTTFGIVRATRGSASWTLGILFLLLSVVFYWGALSYFADEPYSRNRRVSATWAAALLVAGDFLVVNVNLRVPFLCLAALAAAFLYSHTRRLSLGLHASFYLLAATTLSPLPAYVGNALAGTLPIAPSWTVWIVGVAAVLCYVVGARVLEDRDKRRLLWVVPAMLAGFTSAASSVVAVSVLAAGRMELSPSRLSVVRTIMNCVLAFALGFAGSRWKHVELRWVAYAAVAFGTLKLPLEDLRFGNAASLVISLLCYGSVLILLPRQTRRALRKNE
ncbi:MAG: hypothetical protein ACM34E_07130 [Acidobacteriota bacterium]